MVELKGKTPLADIIIVNYRSADYLKACVVGLQAQTVPNFRVFLVDNSPENGDVDRLGPLDDRFTVLPQSGNTGFARGSNIGAAQGSAPFVVMLNPDAAPATDWLESLLACIVETGAGMAGSTQLMATDPSRLDGAGDAYSPIGVAWRGGFERPAKNVPETGSCFSPCAAASIYRREVFDAVGGFDERFFCYMEDVDIGYRIRLRGGFGVQCRRSIVHHVGSASSAPTSPFVIYHGTRNRIWTFLKNTPPLLLIAMLPAHVLINLAFLVRSFVHRRFRTTWKATLDGVGGWGWIMRERRELARTRTVGSLGIARSLTWSPLVLLRRAPDIRPLETGQTE
ncbi:glycosyltransferase family 2 protein [Hyphobacterium sp. CCMP332]|uniref:glycosyltransferase family 2 protein n=1 Tax=Hyphobacterium sp. CCMP332 TaxID=2749086 RepID=UPI00164EF0B3|nr:glycosyltransferase family 2 protein [Hyphobacterium sp. CCMP332]QNL17891.1 glycosyltransferase family 2 protein [Hyphobacterium sp. CCMP332]